MRTGSTLITLDMLSSRIKAYFFLPAAFFLAAASSISCILAMARPAPLRAPVIKSPALTAMFSTCACAHAYYYVWYEYFIRGLIRQKNCFCYNYSTAKLESEM